MKFHIPLISKNNTGFRLSILDIFVFLFGLILTYIYQYYLFPEIRDPLFKWFIIFILINFFLFCNVFRVNTKYELIWIFSFLFNSIIYISSYSDILLFLIIQSSFSFIVIFLEIKSGFYRGIFANQHHTKKEKE